MRYKGLKSIFALLCVGLLMVSCSDSHLQNAAGPTVLPIEDVTVHPLGDEFTVAYTAKHPWKILLSGVESNWLTASVVKGDIGTTSITFKVNPNIVDGDRSCNISFCNSNSNKVLDSFCVSQEMVVLSTDVSSHNFGWQKSSDNGSLLSITSNIEWALTLNDDKIDFDSEKCIYCRQCEAICPLDAIRIVNFR